MNLIFYKYQGTGNDFVMIDNRNLFFPKERTDLIAFLCDRRFGIGADGLILLESDPTLDFKMVYYNSDGNESTMCGNGGRCLVAFAKQLGVIENTASFNAVDGVHHASVKEGLVSLQMTDVSTIRDHGNYLFLNTGSPHHVQFVNNLNEMDVNKEGKKLRYGIYGASGSNINFVQQINSGENAIRTYERGVEGETYSCGTGVTAAAIGIYQTKKQKNLPIVLHTKGGILSVRFKESQGVYTDIFLEGPATFVYRGEISVDV